MRCILLLLVLPPCCGCRSEPDLEGMVDRRVREEWMQPGQFQDAIAFLENGGSYYNSPDANGETPLDQEVILPLLKDLQAEFQRPIHAITLDDPDRAWSIVMPFPEDPAERQRVIDWIDAANEEFPGMILEEIGQEWLTLDFLDEEEARLVEEIERELPAS